MNKNITISTRTILITLGVLGIALALYQVIDIIVQIVIALIFSLAIEPAVSYMSKRIPRALAVGLVYSLLILLIVVFFTFALPMVADQIKKLALSLPNLINTVGFMPDIKTLVSSSVSQITSASGSVFSVTVSLFSNALNIISVFIFSLYLSFDFPVVKKRFFSLFSDELRPAINQTVVETEQNLSRWIMGQLFLMLVIGLISYVGLAAFGVPYALPLAIIAGFLEVVPVLGPIVATIVASVVGFAVSPNMGILVIALFFGIQQLENNLLVPKVMQSVAGFNPLVTMVALLVGAKLMGVVGALVAIPLTLVFIIAFKNLVSIDLDEQ